MLYMTQKSDVYQAQLRTAAPCPCDHIPCFLPQPGIRDIDAVQPVEVLSGARLERDQMEVWPFEKIRGLPDLPVHLVLLRTVNVPGVAPSRPHPLPCQKRPPLRIEPVDPVPQVSVHGEADADLVTSNLKALFQIAVAMRADVELCESAAPAIPVDYVSTCFVGQTA